MTRRLVLPLTLALAASGLSACWWSGSSDLADALALVPTGATSVEFVDRHHLAERLGVDDVHTGASADDLTRYKQAVADQPATGTDLFLPALRSMQDAPFSELDVRWSVVGRVGTRSFQTFRLDDDVDLDALGDDLAGAGFTEGELDGRRHFTALPETVTDPTNGLVAGHFPAGFLDVTLDPDRHLLVVGPAADDVWKAADDDAPSLGDDHAWDALLPSDRDAVELALLDPAPDCGARIGNLSDEQVDLAVRQSAALATPTATSYVVDAAGTRAVLRFSDDATATSDAAARRTYLASGRLVTSGSPLSGLGTADVTTSGPLETVDVHFDPARATELAERGDGFLLCHVAPPAG